MQTREAGGTAPDGTLGDKTGGPSPAVRMVVCTDRPGAFYPLLQRGVGLRVRVGVSIRDLLCEQLGINPEYLRSRIQTIFLDGRPVDDSTQAWVRDGSTLALSAAMPGLVGAVMRSGGPIAGFRSSITYRADADCVDGPCKSGRVVLKLFNLLVDELGPGLLARGVRVEAFHLAPLLVSQLEESPDLMKHVTIDGSPADPESFRTTDWATGLAEVALVVDTGG